MNAMLLIALLLNARIALIAQLTAPPSPAQQVFLLHLPGIGGELPPDHMLLRGLQQGGLDATYKIYDWTGSEAGMLSLGDVKLHETQARKVAQIITEYRQQHPTDRIILTSHSGGAGIAAWALEDLAPGVNIDTWVMLEPALSPKFDLSKALSHVNGKAYAFTSVHDVLVLGAGTQLMGTIDRVKTEAAGMTGFQRPESASVADYAKLVAVPYDIAWMRFGNFGDHIGPLMRPFARHVLAPTLLDGEVPKIPPLIPTTTPAGH